MIKFYYGVVNSGKSLHLLSSYLTEKRKGEGEVKLIKPGFDTRTEGVYTRFGNVEMRPDLIVEENNPENRLCWLNILSKGTTFFIDELQFFSPKYVEDILKNKTVDQVFNIYGLRNDFYGNMWESVALIMNFADEITEIKTHCELCKVKKASFNMKISDSLEINDPGFHYIPVCRDCFKIPHQHCE